MVTFRARRATAPQKDIVMYEEVDGGTGIRLLVDARCTDPDELFRRISELGTLATNRFWRRAPETPHPYTFKITRTAALPAPGAPILYEDLDGDIKIWVWDDLGIDFALPLLMAVFEHVANRYWGGSAGRIAS